MHFFFLGLFPFFPVCFLKSGGDGCRETAFVPNLRKKKKLRKKSLKKKLFLVEYNETFPDKGGGEKNGGKKSRKM